MSQLASLDIENIPRKYFSYSSQRLEDLFKEQIDNVDLLLELQAELTHRKTVRAARLCKCVMDRLTALGVKVVSQESTSQGSPSIPLQQHQSTPYSEEQQSTPYPQSPPPKSPATNETPRAEVRRATPEPLPPITNRPEEILSAWTALEVLSPPSYIRPEDFAGGDRTRVAPLVLGESKLPWERGEGLRPNLRLYYQIVFGSIELAPAVEQLIERYGDSREEKPGVRGKAVLAVVAVDRQGQLVESPAVGISSFGWGVMSALNGKLADLARWPEIESQLVEQIEKLLLGVRKGDEDQKELRKRPLTHAALFAAYHKLVQELKLPTEWVEPPEFAIRSYAYYNDPEPLLLNSFFLQDLALARKLFKEGKAPNNLKRYLGLDRPRSCQDLLHDSGALAEAVRPSLTHLARWPSQNRHSLVLLQQAAVNLAFRETKAGGLLGVNGPPGTGKTTLLRDLIAGVVTERAEAMVKFDDPEKAFEHSGLRLRAGNGWIHLYRLNQSLRGFEMVVTSSNNKAVENVSAELPNLSAIATDAQNLRYFKTLSDVLHQSETWGAIAAVLGNAQNRARFKQAFWWDKDNGLKSYLCAAAGAVREVEGTDPVTGETENHVPHIVEVEKPPSSHREALERWKEAQKRFLSALGKSHAQQTRLDRLYDDLEQLQKLTRTEASAEARRDAAIENVRQLKGLGDPSQQLHNSDQELSVHDLSKPGFWARLFRTRTARKWSELRLALLEWQSAETAWQAASEQHRQVKQRLDEAQQKHGVVLTDTAFFEQEPSKRQQSTPWFSPDAQRLRDDVFISAMAVHRAFIDAAAKPLRHNLGALMKAFTTQTLPNAEKQALLPDLWTSLFLVVPLVSTTFASVTRMLGKLPPESLGWLFVDEAGQALPQAAVGALLRTRRAVIVGDPVQIEPVVVLPDTLTQAICRRFGVDPDHYAAPSASVQTLADAASTYISEFETDIGSRSVGVPLLVHRRCSEPMFSISNTIAYSGMMVSAKSPKPSAIRDVLGPSRWIHIEGSGNDKWCPEEGDEVLRLLRQIAQSGVKPDLYIITPFVIVADRLRQTVRESGVLRGWVDEDDWSWTNERIGTVHTVQGREAEAVILVLGAPNSTQTGARGWAGGRPNLLNVAVTRAKEAIYVIGNRQLWQHAGSFQQLDKRLP
jgi:energy-coupling factor transporter ATP-binding protein EcfA2